MASYPRIDPVPLSVMMLGKEPGAKSLLVQPRSKTPLELDLGSSFLATCASTHCQTLPAKSQRIFPLFKAIVLFCEFFPPQTFKPSVVVPKQALLSSPATRAPIPPALALAWFKASLWPLAKILFFVPGAKPQFVPFLSHQLAGTCSTFLAIVIHSLLVIKCQPSL